MSTQKGSGFILTKICRTCNSSKEENLFRKSYRKGDSYGKFTNQCRDCYSDYDKQWRAKNNGKYNLGVRSRRLKNKLFAIERLGGVCVECKQVVHPAAFDFHHTDPSIKDSHVSLLMSMKKENFIPELDKCILLCSNCHRVKHYIEGYRE